MFNFQKDKSNIIMHFPKTLFFQNFENLLRELRVGPF